MFEGNMFESLQNTHSKKRLGEHTLALAEPEPFTLASV